MTHRGILQRFGACVVLAGLCVATRAVAGEPASARPERRARAGWRAGPQLQSLRPAAALAGPFRPTVTPSLDGSPVEYLILTSDGMAPEFERLAAWKTAKGVPAVVRTLSQVEASGEHGSDLAETIRLYIKRAYLYWGVRFVLLGGDTDVIPARYTTTEFLGLTNPVTDMYYSCLDGDWNANGNAYIGEAYKGPEAPGDDADLISDVFLGRAPASTPQEARVLVDKTLAYERPATLEHQGRTLMLAEVLFPADYRPGDTISDDGARYAEFIRQNFLPPTMQIKRLYETWDLPENAGSSPLRLDSSTAEINAGYGTVLQIGHGYRYTLSVGDGSLTAADAARFTNGTRSGLFYMLNCTAAAFDFECFAEALLLNPNGGAALVLGSARETFPLAAGDYEFAFFNHVYVFGERRVGEAMARSREEFAASAQVDGVDRWTQFVYTLLGDPEASLWGARPRPLELVGLPDTLAVGGQGLDLLVRDEVGPVAGALVCASKSGDEYRVARSDAGGRLHFDLEPRSAGSASFIATAADHLPLEVGVPVAVPGTALVVAATALVDDGAGAGTGNLDGRWDAGETVQLLVTLRAAGRVAVTQLQASLESDGVGVQVLQGASPYPDLGPGQQASNMTPFVLRAASNWPDGGVMTLALRLDSAAGSVSRRLELPVHAAILRFLSLRLDDARAGDGDGVQEPGEEVDLYYTLQNLGSGTAQGARLFLGGVDPGFEVLAGVATVPDLAPGTSGENAPRLTVRQADLVNACRGTLVLRHLQNPDGERRGIDLRLPAAPEAPSFGTALRVDEVHLVWTRPEGADLLGYHVYRALLPAGPFTRADADLVRFSFFRDRGLEPSTRYYYRVVAVDSALAVGPPSPVSSASTNPPQSAGWPLSTNDNSSSSVAIGDLLGNGKLDVVAGSRQIYAWDGQGVELVDADHSALTWGLLYGTNESFGSVTLAHLDRAAGLDVVAATWDPIQRFVVVLNGRGEVLPGWPQALPPADQSSNGAQVAPVVADLDASAPAEILLAARDGRLYAWHADGTEVADGDANPNTRGVLLDTGSPYLRCAPGVADLDPARPGLEIVIGGTNGVLYALDAGGRALPGWPRTAAADGVPFGALFASGISIADLDRDRVLECIFLELSGRLHAMHLDGSELPGFPVSGIQAFSQALVPSPAIGDLVGDGNLEIVVASSDGNVRMFDAAGQSLLPGGAIVTGRATESSPILGDVDGDGRADIVLGNEDGVLYAWRTDGSLVDGFPIILGAEVRGTPALADVNGDGKSELTVLTWDGVAHVFELGAAWDPAHNPWPTYRGNGQRTGEYGFAPTTPVAAADLGAEFAPDRGVRLRWKAVGALPGVALTWRLHRAGPFASNPLAAGAHFDYNGRPVGEIRGSGDLEFVDPLVEPGAWYVYILELQEQPGGAGEGRIAGSIAVETVGPPSALGLLANVPNPFNPGTRLRFEVPSRSGSAPVEVLIAVYDAQGRRVRLLLRGRRAPGQHVVDWDGRDDRGAEVSSGIYVARLRAAGREVCRKLTLLR